MFANPLYILVEIVLDFSLGEKLYISRSTARRILKNAGATRVSNRAIVIFQNRLNRIAYEGASKSIRLARHAKRRTVDISDVQLAMNR